MFGDFLSSAQDERFRSLQEIPGAKTLFFARNCKMSRCTFKCTGRLHNLKSRAVSFNLFDFFSARLPRDLIFFIFGNRPYDPYPSSSLISFFRFSYFDFWNPDVSFGSENWIGKNGWNWFIKDTCSSSFPTPLFCESQRSPGPGSFFPLGSILYK